MVMSLASAAPTMKVRPDPVPRIRDAGKFIATGGHNADLCLRADLFPKEKPGNPGTPPHILKYRKLAHIEPGQIQVHPGLADAQQKVPSGHTYGKPLYVSDHVETVIKAQNLAGLADKFNDTMESKYDTHKREPLGRGYSRDYAWPAQTEQGKIAFGLPTKDSIKAKDILYPAGGSQEESQEHAQMYKRTHSNYYPGEQRVREYDWNSNPVIQGQPQTYSFGFGEQRLLNGAAKAVHHERIGDEYPKTVIVKKVVEDVKAVTSDMLGTVRNLGQSQPSREPEFTYGHKNDYTAWNAAKCITGEANEQELAPDHDLGRSVKPNCSNTVRRSVDQSRSFGCPTIRTDIPFKVWRSVADYANYGDEPEAVDLMYPATSLELGISEQDFQQLRDRQTIKDLFEKIGHSFKVGKFNTIYNKAKEISNSADDRVSVRAFLQSIKIYADLE